MLIDEFETIFPLDDDEKDFQLVHEFLTVLQESHLHQVVIIAVTSALHTIDSTLQKKFDEIIFVDVPSSNERLLFISHYCNKLLFNLENNINNNSIVASNSMGDNNEEEEEEVEQRQQQQQQQRLPQEQKQNKDSNATMNTIIEYIYSKCHGLVYADLIALFRHLAKLHLNHVLSMSNIEEAISSFFSSYKSYSLTQSSSAANSVPLIPQVKWEDIGGLNLLKQQLLEIIVWPLKHSDAYKRMGITPCSGLLLYGPPGVGKTLIAKAVATAAQSNFIAVNIPDLIKSEVGESEKSLSDVFRRAKLAAPCVVFFDEIQAMFGDRDAINKDQQKLVSQFLIELDAMNETLQENFARVIVIAATNVPWSLDSSLLRPGRLEKVVMVQLPDAQARKHIILSAIKKMKVSQAVLSSIDKFVELSNQFSGADLVNTCNQAGLNALFEEADEISLQHFRDAFESTVPSVTPELMQLLQEWQK